MANRVLVLGNGPSINDIEFDKLQDGVITYGVNRIWLKHIPNYFFFHDLDILTEINRRSDIIDKLKQNSNCFTSDWIRRSKIAEPNWIRKYPRINRRAFPDSVTTGLDILIRNILKHDPKQYTFYIAGVNLRWTEPSHFWKCNSYNSLNTNDKRWYTPRFNQILKNFARLQGRGYNMISVTPCSNLNKIMRYESIKNLYDR